MSFVFWYYGIGDDLLVNLITNTTAVTERKTAYLHYQLLPRVPLVNVFGSNLTEEYIKWSSPSICKKYVMMVHREKCRVPEKWLPQRLKFFYDNGFEFNEPPKKNNTY